MQPQPTVVPTTTKFQSNATNDTENALITAVKTITLIPIGAVLLVTLASGPDIGAVAQPAIGAISGVAVAAIGAITVAMRMRRTRTRRS
ncbi:hypothetical protein ABZ949_14625 [Micromonospora tulbaghiae]|uniref:hypothetical protein n=1 Tax=Micromonospora tulbaghiae TaxID=479978 RepID=UPI0033E0BA93